MSKSTAVFIPYDIRPAKQTERRGIIEFLNCAKHAGFDISRYRYVGFGGTKFIDFQLMEKYVGFSKYISIEHDPDIFNRCKFNKPFSFIDMYNGPFTDFISVDSETMNSVYWLDFEIGLSSDLIENVNSISSKSKNGDIILITVKAEAPRGRGLVKDMLKSQIPNFKSFIDKFTPMQFTSDKFPNTVGLILLQIFKSAFSSRVTEGKFYPIFKVTYKDGTQMCTIGGVFCSNHSKRPGRIKRAVEQSVPVMCPKKRDSFYNIPLFNLTQLERILVEKTDVNTNCGYKRRLLSLGIEQSYIDKYHEISRFIPKYTETAF